MCQKIKIQKEIKKNTNRHVTSTLTPFVKNKQQEPK